MSFWLVGANPKTSVACNMARRPESSPTQIESTETQKNGTPKNSQEQGCSCHAVISCLQVCFIYVHTCIGLNKYGYQPPGLEWLAWTSSICRCISCQCEGIDSQTVALRKTLLSSSFHLVLQNMRNTHIGSIYGIFTHISHVGKYTIHWSMGYVII